jgi:hypothetical protein
VKYEKFIDQVEVYIRQYGCLQGVRVRNTKKYKRIISGVASGPAVPPGGTRNLKKNEEMFYSEAKFTAFLILKIYIIMIIFQCFHLFI